LKGLDYDKFIKTEGAPEFLAAQIKATFLKQLEPEGYDKYALDVKFSKGSVKATVGVRPRQLKDPQKLKDSMTTNKDAWATSVLNQVKLMPKVKDKSMLEDGQTVNTLKLGLGSVLVETNADTTATTTSTTSTTEEGFGPADLADMSIPHLPTGAPHSGAFATVSPEEKAIIDAQYKALEPTTTTTTKLVLRGITDGAPSKGLLLVLLCLALRLGLLAN
jgi:hypothetical protein